MLENKKVIIFDLDGTLIDSVGIWNEVDFRAIKEFTGKEIDLELIQKERDRVIFENKDKQVYEVYTEYLLNQYHIEATLEKVITRRREIAYEYITKIIDYKEDADLVLKKLKQSGYTLVLATTSAKRTIDNYNNHNNNLIKKAKIYDVFDLVLTNEDVKEKKPSPEIYLTVLKKLNVKAEECIIVEDSLEGVKAAKAAKIEVINIPDKYSNENQKQIDKIADYKINSLKQFLKLL